MIDKDTITFYVNDYKRFHCSICCSNKTFSTDLFNNTPRQKMQAGFSCYELKNIHELQDLIICLKYKGFKEIDYFMGENNESC